MNAERELFNTKYRITYVHKHMYQKSHILHTINNHDFTFDCGWNVCACVYLFYIHMVGKENWNWRAKLRKKAKYEKEKNILVMKIEAPH